MDLWLGCGGEELDRSLEAARAVIERTCALDRWAYVLHLESKDVRDYQAWIERAVCSPDRLAEWAGKPELLVVENLEKYSLDFIDPVIERTMTGRCMDVGHSWLEGHDPLPYHDRWLPRTRVIHLHGIGSRDRQSLAHQEAGEIYSVLNLLNTRGYGGVLTMEAFGQEDFETSLTALNGSGLQWDA